MKIDIRTESGTTIIKPNGTMDFAGLSEFSATLNRTIIDGATKVLLDFSTLEYLSSSGIRSLMEGMKLLEPKGGTLAFCSLNAQLKELFEVVQLTKLFPIYETEFEALDALID